MLISCCIRPFELTRPAGCRKGQRECVYPDQSNQRPSKDGTKNKTAAAGSPSSGDDTESSDRPRLPPIQDEGDDTASGTASSRLAAHDSMSPPGQGLSPTSPTDLSASGVLRRPPVSRTTSKAQQQQQKTTAFASPKWASLPKDIRMYIKYHRENITCHHYALKHDHSNFLKTTFLEIALSYEPLLYAITAFSAYFHTLTRPDGKVQNFLSYYNKSVSLLRDSLSTASRHSTATLLTILQLATFEVS